MRPLLTIAATLLLATSAFADDGGMDDCLGKSSADKPPSSTGLSVIANAGAYWADKVTANFYSGRPENDDINHNTIDRILHSNTYGQQIWQNLKTQGLISDAVESYQNLQIVEYPDMYYRTSYQVGAGIRYDYASGIGWLLRADLSRLEAIGAFNLSTDNGVGILGGDQYIRCGMLGQEDRINIDLAITGQLDVGGNIVLEVDLGASLINTKVRENIMEIGGATYSILNRTGGQTPDYGVGSYEYINQGGVGYGVFMSALVGYLIPSIGSLKAGYTCYQSKTVLTGYTAWGWQHMLGVRIEMNNFKLFN